MRVWLSRAQAMRAKGKSEEQIAAARYKNVVIDWARQRGLRVDDEAAVALLMKLGHFVRNTKVSMRNAARGSQ